MSKTPRCTYVAPDGWMTPEHRNDCNHPSCPGCRPCSKDHCALRNGCPNHVDHAAGIVTCPSCIGRTRKDLKTIVRLSLFDIPVEAIDAGIDSEAMNLTAVASIALPIDSRRGWCHYPPREHHPFTVLAGWELTLREDYGPNTQLRLTIPRAADYLDTLLNGGFPHERRFEDFAGEIRRCRAHLEAVVHDSLVPETGAPCPECEGKAPKLIKRYGDSTGRHLNNCDGGDCRGCSDDRDTWHCPADPAHWWSNADYWNRIEGKYLNPAEWMNAKDAANELGISIGALKVRAVRKPKGRSRRDGSAVYSVTVLAS